MKRRKGYRFTDDKGFSWDGDCPIWAAQCRTLGYTESRIFIYGKKWTCHERH